jgi:hypothetical protein
MNLVHHGQPICENNIIKGIYYQTSESSMRQTVGDYKKLDAIRRAGFMIVVLMKAAGTQKKFLVVTLSTFITSA